MRVVSALLLLLLFYPWFLWDKLLLVNISIVLIVLLFLLHTRRYAFSFNLLGLFSIFLLSILDKNIVGILFSVLTFVVLFVEHKLLIQSLDTFSKILSYCFFFGLIVYFLGLFDIVFYESILNPLNNLKEFYVNRYFLVFENGSLDGLRFYSLFDEPGVVGMLAFNNILVLSKKRRNFFYLFINILSGVVSFSFYFYIMFGIYVLIYFKSISLKIFLIISFLIIMYLFNDFYIFNRIIFLNSDLNQRSSIEVLEYFNYFLKYGNLLFGNGSSYTSSMGFDGDSSIILFIINYGFIFILPMLYSLIYIAYANMNNILNTLFVFSLIAILYHRPGTFLYSGYLILFVQTFYYLRSNE